MDRPTAARPAHTATSAAPDAATPARSRREKMGAPGLKCDTHAASYGRPDTLDAR